MIKIKVIFFVLLILGGCSSIPIQKNSTKFIELEEYYVLKEDIDLMFVPRTPEFFNLKEKITKQEYRILQHYLQNCYEKKGEKICMEHYR